MAKIDMRVSDQLKANTEEMAKETHEGNVTWLVKELIMKEWATRKYKKKEGMTLEGMA